MNKKNNYVHYVGAFIMIVIAVFFVKAIFFSANQQMSNGAVVATNIAEAREVDGVQEVTLSWGKLNYNPEVIKVKKGKPVRIIADTSRLAGCFRSFRIPDLGVQKSFTESDNTVEFTPQKTGTFGFGCSMGMGNGKLVVL